MRPRPSRLVFAVLAALVGLMIVACGGADETSVPQPTGADAQDVELLQGREVWIRSCAGCHGLAGGGASGPRLAGVVVDHFPDASGQIAVVRDGRAMMPAFGGRLTPDEIEAVVRYTREVL